uniref:Uncharacterized protein n=3 Tax=Sus scrofa TaxID=9823 RepID=A0A8D1QYB4_PIG
KSLPGEINSLTTIYPVFELSYNLEFRCSLLAADPGPLLLSVPGAPVAPSVHRRGGSRVVATSWIMSRSSRVSGSPPPFRQISNSSQQVASSF